MEAVLADYETQRNESAMALYRANLAAARFAPPPPEERQLVAALYQNQDQHDIDRFLMMRMGMLSPALFFDPENIGQIMRKAGAASGKASSWGTAPVQARQDITLQA
jgi:hypothetical protein